MDLVDEDLRMHTQIRTSKKKNSVVFMCEQTGNLGKEMKTIQKELNGNSRTGNNWNVIGWACLLVIVEKSMNLKHINKIYLIWRT